MSQVFKGWRWGRVVAEALVIVLSILLAFGIEAWWSARGERHAEVEALQGLRDDFVENLGRLASGKSEHVEIRDASVRLLAMTGPDADPPVSDLVMDTLVMALIGGPKVFPVTATYDALIASGRIELLESPALRLELARLVDGDRRPSPGGARGVQPNGPTPPALPVGLCSDRDTRSERSSEVRGCGPQPGSVTSDRYRRETGGSGALRACRHAGRAADSRVVRRLEWHVNERGRTRWERT